MDIKVIKKNGVSLTAESVRRVVPKNGIKQARDGESVTPELAAERAAEPIKQMDDIMRVAAFLKANKRWRDYMLFIVGINFGLRVSDLRELRFSDLINDNLTFKETFAVFEKKTRNTRKKKKNRHITINDAVCDAVLLFLKHNKDVSLSDFLFRSESNNGKTKNEPLSPMSIDRILKGIADDCGLTMKVSTHTLRKTFAYHQMLISNNDPRKLLLLQKILGHSSVAQTLDYIGITEDEIVDAYKELNLGKEEHKVIDSELCAEEAV